MPATYWSNAGRGDGESADEAYMGKDASDLRLAAVPHAVSPPSVARAAPLQMWAFLSAKRHNRTPEPSMRQPSTAEPWAARHPEVAETDPQSYWPTAPGRWPAVRRSGLSDTSTGPTRGDRGRGPAESQCAGSRSRSRTGESMVLRLGRIPVPSGLAGLPRRRRRRTTYLDFGTLVTDGGALDLPGPHFGAARRGHCHRSSLGTGDCAILEGVQLADLDYKRPRALNRPRSGAPTEGQSIAAKGEATGEGKRR